MNLRLSHGLTLIEMLVVLLIMGLLVSVTALSTGLAGRTDSEDAARTAEDLSRLFEHAAQQALARGDAQRPSQQPRHAAARSRRRRQSSPAPARRASTSK